LAINQDHHKFCQRCGKPLWLKERYQALKLIGQGGFGKTFLAVDLDKPSQPRCVIKQFFPQAQDKDSLEKAAQLFQEKAKRLDDLGNHNQIPELLAYFVIDDQRQYLVQEYVAGENLAQELDNEGVFSEQKIWALLTDLLPVLEFIHGHLVIHRDIKPENIIRRQSNQQLVLVDFGAAKAVNPHHRSVTGTVIGSAEYVAPEQMNGKAVNASDLYSLGVTCLHLLTGISPFDLFDQEEHEWCWRQYLVNNPVSDELGSILEKMVLLGTKKRYQNAGQVLAELSIVKTRSASEQKQTVKTRIHAPTNQTKVSIPATLKTQVKPGNPQIIIETLSGGIKLEMIKIPAGSFLMGSNECVQEKPIHQVNLREFYLGKYCVTQEQWKAIYGNNPSYFKGGFLSANSRHPVEQVTWLECRVFCQAIRNFTGKKYRLPTEAEWEYACRAGTESFYAFGDTQNVLGDYAWYADNSVGQTHPVGRKKPNPWGLYDLHGNVWEWCEDGWHDNYQGALTDGNAWIENHTGSKVIRGGAWSTHATCCRSTYRDKNNFQGSYYGLGFRVALDWI
jgi:formylglycine-generating enzyme required for sulfatase activity